MKRGERPERGGRIVRAVPFIFGGFAVVGLIAVVAWLFNELSLTQTVSQRTVTAVMRTNQFATEIASRPTETIGPTSTIDINAAATLQRVATQTFAPFAVQTQVQVNMLNTVTQSSLQTIIALTPSNTPTSTRTPSRIPSPTFTFTPTVVRNFVNVGSPGCFPRSILPAGLITINHGVGRWATIEQANAAIGDTTSKFTINGRQEGTPIRSGPTWHTGDGEPGYGFDSKIELLLQAGEYDVVATWKYVNRCKLTVTNP